MYLNCWKECLHQTTTLIFPPAPPSPTNLEGKQAIDIHAVGLLNVTRAFVKLYSHQTAQIKKKNEEKSALIYHQLSATCSVLNWRRKLQRVRVIHSVREICTFKAGIEWQIFP